MYLHSPTILNWAFSIIKEFQKKQQKTRSMYNRMKALANLTKCSRKLGGKGLGKIKCPINPALKFTIKAVGSPCNTSEKCKRCHSVFGIEEDLWALTSSVVVHTVSVLYLVGVHLEGEAGPVHAIVAVTKTRNAIPVVGTVDGVNMSDHFENSALVSPDKRILPSANPSVTRENGRFTSPGTFPGFCKVEVVSTLPAHKYNRAVGINIGCWVIATSQTGRVRGGPRTSGTRCCVKNARRQSCLGALGFYATLAPTVFRLSSGVGSSDVEQKIGRSSRRGVYNNMGVVRPDRKSLRLKGIRAEQSLAGRVDDPTIRAPVAKSAVTNDFGVEEMVGVPYKHRIASPSCYVGRISVRSSFGSR